jgi:plasmid stability protein
MTTLTIRNLPDEVQQKLREIAAANGRSMEAEARAVLTDAAEAARRKRVSNEAAEALRRLREMIERLPPAEQEKISVDSFLAERRKMRGEE